MTAPHYPHTRRLVVAASLSLLGQVSAIAFMLAPNPYTTFLFMAVGTLMILLGMLIFGYVMFREIKARTESVCERTHEAGEVIFRQGDVGDRVYVVRSGQVEVIREYPDEPGKEEKKVAELGEGEYFGEMSLLTNAPRNATVRAVTPVTTLSIARHDFQSLFAGIPAFKRSIEAVMKSRARRLTAAHAAACKEP